MKNEKFKLSYEQELALDIHKNIAVSAGAGSGKTRVLTGRYLKLLEAGYEIEEIAAITFTEKAALEMKQRIREAVITEISLSEGQDKINWMKHLDKLSIANISTIHGFCSNIVKENAAYLKLDFDFGIINEIDKSIILKEAGDAARKKLFSSLKYSAFVEKITDIYSEKYLRSDFLGEVLDIRKKILNLGKNIDGLYNNAEENSIDKFIFHLAKEIDIYYSSYKLSIDMLDYNDLEIMTLKILEDNRFRERYRKRYKTLLVDEFQDTNEIQRKIIYHITADDKGMLIPSRLFIVGDFKQSIYGFRGTDHTIFKNVSEDMGTEGKVPLSTCYRSKSEIIEGVNSIFKVLILDYEPLNCPKDELIAEKRIKVITYNKDNSASSNVLTDVKNLLQGKASLYSSLDEAFKALRGSCSKISLPQNNGGIAAVKAIKLLRDKGLNFKDICILVRSRSAVPEIEEELKRKNVPYCIIGGTGFYQKTEVDEILNLYKVIIRGFEGEFSYEDNINFIKVLRGPLFEIPDNIILNIKIGKDECRCQNLYEAINYVNDGMEESEDREKLQKVYNTLKNLNMLKDRLSVLQILKAIINECSIYEIMLCYEDGIQKYRNIEKLVHIAKKFDSEELFTPKQFVEYIKLLNENDIDDSEAALDTEDSEAVKIMTIHQSKGLEFKGVIIPKIQADLLSISKRHKANIVYYNEAIILSKNLKSGEDTAAYQEYITQELAKEVDEYIRLLYVAITRAEDYAILTGEDDGKCPDEFIGDVEKIKQLNSFLKQIKYALDVKNGDNSLIEFLKLEDLVDLEAVTNIISSSQIDKIAVDKKLKFRCRVKPSVNVSASSYMKYKKCPRKYYIENVLRVSGNSYMDTEFAEEVAMDAKTISAAELGTVVHSIIEVLNNEIDIEEEAAITAAVEAWDLKDIYGVKDTLKRYVDNYYLLEGDKKSLGKIIYLSNELEYSLTPYDDRKLSIIGYIDRLEVLENNDKFTVVVTDYKTNRIYDNTRKGELIKIYEPQLQLYGKAGKELLYVNGIKVEDIILQIYFLDKAEKVEINYDENKVQEELKSMDSIFAQNLNECSVNEFPKESRSCDGCDYKEICVVKEIIIS